MPHIDVPSEVTCNKITKTGIYRLIILTRRRSNVTHEEFAQHYLKIHYKYSCRIPGLLSYKQTVIAPGEAPEGVALDGFDAMSEYTYVNKQAYKLAHECEGWTDLQEDTEKFIDIDRMISFVAEDESFYALGGR